MTTIQDTLTYINGAKANGRLVVGWKPFTVGNVNAAGGELEWSIVDGAVSISLYSNTGAQPTGSYYVAKYELENGAVYLEQWMVPDLPTVNLGQVRVAFPPSPSVMISPLQLTSLGAAPGMFLMWNGQRWVPGYPGQFSFVDPTLVKGDIIVRGDTAPATRLGVGADGWTLIADSSQPLGIKWIAPVSGFADPTTTKGDLIVRGNAGTTRIGAGSNAFVLTADSALPLGLKWAAVPLSPQTPWLQDIDGAGFTLKNVGAIGIGTTSPQALLSLGPAGGVKQLWYDGSGNSQYNCGVGLNLASGQGVDVFMGYGTGTDNAFRICRPNAATWPFAAYTALVTVLESGNVGIGTTSPLTTIQAAADVQRQLYLTGGSNPTVSQMRLGFDVTNNTGVVEVFGVSSGNSRPLLLNPLGGNVGIGTTSPGAKLDVQGGHVRISNDYSTGQLQIGSNGSYIGRNLADGSTLIQTGQGYLLLNPFVGNTMVGSGGPANYKLDVAGDVNCSGVFRVQGLPCARVIAYLDQTGARALNTVYQNTQLSALFVAVTLTINAGQFAQLLTDIGNPPTNVICAQTNPSGSTVNQTCNGWVMPNQYYKLNTPSATLIKWFEWQ